MNENSPPDLNQEAEPTQENRKRSGKAKWIILLLLALLLGATGWWYFPTLTQTKSTNQLAQTTEPQSLPPTVAEDQPENQQDIIESLTARIQSLENRRELAPVQQVIPQLDMNSLPHFDALLKDLNALQRKAGTAKPFRAELDKVFTHLTASLDSFGPAIHGLFKLANSGVPTPEQLTQEFESLIAASFEARDKKPTKQSLVDKSKNWAKSLISIRYKAPQQESKVTKDPVIKRVRELLVRGNLLATLEHRKIPGMEQWYQQVESRVFVQQTITDLRPIVLILFILGHQMKQDSDSENEE